MTPRTTCLVASLLAAVLLSASARAADRSEIEATLRRTVELHKAVIGSASPALRTGLTASTRAARDYLQRCGQKCELLGFIGKDLATRFPRASAADRELLGVLVLAELSIGGEQPRVLSMLLVATQEATQAEAGRYQTVSNASKARHDIALNSIRNMKA